MALRGIRVVEIAGLAPAPFCGMILADFGASVIRVDRINAANHDRLGRGKKSIAVNIKDPKGQTVVQKLVSKSDVLIEPFRPGVMEKLNLGPDNLISKNPRLIYARLSGYGQTGPYANKAGHDINYVAISGILSKLGRKGEKPTPPINLLADFAGGGLMCAFGILMSLFERQSSGKGQVVDTSMVEGTAYLSSFIFKGLDSIMWGKERGNNLLDTGAHFYETYETKDKKFMAVGSLEPQFYKNLMKGLELNIPQLSDFEESKKMISKTFATKTRDEWTQIFNELDACVTPILEIDEAPKNEQNAFRNSILFNPNTKLWEPEVAPRLSRTPGRINSMTPDPEVGENTIEILHSIGYCNDDIKELITNEIVTTTALDKIRAEFKSDTESLAQSEEGSMSPRRRACKSASTYRRASQIAIDISLEDLRAQSLGLHRRLLLAISRLFGRAKVAQTERPTTNPANVKPSAGPQVKPKTPPAAAAQSVIQISGSNVVGTGKSSGKIDSTEKTPSDTKKNPKEKVEKSK